MTLAGAAQFRSGHRCISVKSTSNLMLPPPRDRQELIMQKAREQALLKAVKP
jgi:hypothetical protein